MEVQRGQSSPSEREKLRAVEAIEQGVKSLEDGKDDRAIERFSEAIRLNPECARAYRLRSQIYNKTGNWAKAERDIAKARRIEATQV